MKRIDLSQNVVLQLESIFSNYPEIEKVIVFGSRAIGNAKPGSDIDLAFVGKKLTVRKVSEIRDYLENETLFPWFFDCVHFESLQNAALREHIKKYGLVIYTSSLNS